MPTHITGTLGSPGPSGAVLPLKLATLYVSPSQSKQLRIQYGGTGEFITVTANTSLPSRYQYGFASITDSAGAYDFMLPSPTEIHAANLDSFRWNLSLPDGSVFSGPPLGGTGPMSLDDLLQTGGWTLSSSLVVQAHVLGQVAQSTVSFTGQSTVSVQFLLPMADGAYQVFCSPSQDSVTGDVPTFDVTSKTGAGFTIELSFAFTGTMDYLAWHA